MKRILFSFILAMAFFTFTKAQYLAVNGYIFTNDSTQLQIVPFATVKYSDYKDHNKVEYVGFTDLSGQYNLGDRVKSQDYHIEIKAPGYETREKCIGRLPNSFDGNMTFHFEMHKSGSQKGPVSVIYSDSIYRKQSNLIEAVKSLPVVSSIEETDVLSQNGNTLKLLLNGYSFDMANLVYFRDLPTAVVKDIEYYDLSAYNTIYEGVINVVLAEGEQAGSPDFAPAETSYYDIP